MEVHLHTQARVLDSSGKVSSREELTWFTKSESETEETVVEQDLL
jgi:hypothetical protein